MTQDKVGFIMYVLKGDRKKANRGVFKLLRLKSNRTLRKFQSREKRLQKCSKCKNTGHNSLNKNCPVNIDLSEMVEDAVEDQMDITVTGEQDEFEENVDQGEEDLADIDELLFSDDDLF